MAQDVGIVWMCCIVPILFGWFLSVPSLYALVFLWKTFLWLVGLYSSWSKPLWYWIQDGNLQCRVASVGTALKPQKAKLATAAMLQISSWQAVWARIHLSTVIKSEPNLKARPLLKNTASKVLWLTDHSYHNTLYMYNRIDGLNDGNYWNVIMVCPSEGKLLECKYCWLQWSQGPCHYYWFQDMLHIRSEK